MSEEITKAFGWIPDVPSLKDYSVDTPDVSQFFKDLKKKRPSRSRASASPDFISNQQHCSPVENQGALGSCTAQAGVGFAEYLHRKLYGKHVNLSRRFLYKVTRRLSRLTGDSGAYLRDTMKAMVVCGIPPEEWWPYQIASFDVEPDSFAYSLAQPFKSANYHRLDSKSVNGQALLDSIEETLASGLLAMFGFSVVPSIDDAATTGDIPFPADSESMIGGHAVLAVGYDRGRKITNKINNKTTTGAIKIKNSWGTRWGQAGYGWLPTQYVLDGLAVDWWTFTDQGWVDLWAFN